MFWGFAGLVGFFLVFTFFSETLEDRSPFASSYLTSSVSETDTTITVTSTANWPSSGRIYIEEEIVCYSSKTSTAFIVASSGRGCNDSGKVARTTIKSHNSGKAVYNSTGSALSATLDYNLINELEGFSGESVGGVMTFGGRFLIEGLPRYIQFDYSFFQTTVFGFPMVIVRVFLLGIIALPIVVYATYSILRGGASLLGRLTGIGS